MSVSIRPAVLDDGAAILDLVRRTPQQGLVQLNFERDPDFFLGAGVSCEEPDIWVAEQAGLLAAVFNIGHRSVFINGVPQRVRYAHDLRIDSSVRGGLLLHRMFRHLRRLLAPGEWMQTVILSGNAASLETVGSGRAGLPAYYPYGEIETSLLATAVTRRRSEVPGVTVVRATAADLPAMQAFIEREGARRQFFPSLRLARMLAEDRYFTGLSPDNFLLARRDGRLVGMLGDWDQSAFRRTRVLHYPGVLRLARLLLNALGPFTGGLRLPPPGGSFRYRTLHTLLVQDDDTGVLRQLLDQVLADRRGSCDALVCGMFIGDPLRPLLREYRRRTLASQHFLVSYDGDPRASLDPRLVPYVDLARL